MSEETEIVYNVTRIDGKEITEQDQLNFKDFTKNQWEEKFPEFDKEYSVFFGIVEYKIIKKIVPVDRLIINYIS